MNELAAGDDLQVMVDAHGKLEFQPPVKLIEDTNARRVFGSPALGYVSQLYRQGTKLIADLTDVPAKFAEIIG